MPSDEPPNREKKTDPKNNGRLRGHQRLRSIMQSMASPVQSVLIRQTGPPERGVVGRSALDMVAIRK